MAITVEQFVAELGWDIDSTQFKEFQGQIERAGQDLKRLTKWIVGAGAAITGMAVVTNEATAQQYRLAQSVGASAETVEALSHTLGGLGFDSERVVDLIEEMSNKFGELKGLGEMTSATDALKILNLEFQNLRDLAPEEQFIAIMDAAKSMADQQEAVSAVDMLMGGEANKVLGYLRTQEGSLRDLVTQYRALTLLTEEGREGAVRFSDQWRTLTLVGKSFVQEFSGQFGDAIAPLVEDTVDWAIANKALIKSEVKDWAEGLADAIRDIGGFLRVLNGYIQQFGGYEIVIKRIGFAFAAWRIGGIVSSASKLIGDLRLATTGAGALGKVLSSVKLSSAFTGGLALLIPLLAQDIWTSLHGGESAFSGIAQAVADAAGNVDEFIADMLGIPVDEFRAGMLSALDAIVDGWDTADEKVTEFRDDALWAVASVLDSFGQWGDGIWATLEDAKDRTLEGLKALGAEVLAWLADLGSSVAETIAGFLGDGILSRANDIANMIRGVFGAAPQPLHGGTSALRPRLPPPTLQRSSTVTNDNRQYTLSPSATINGRPAGSSGEARWLTNQLENMLGQSVAALGG